MPADAYVVARPAVRDGQVLVVPLTPKSVVGARGGGLVGAFPEAGKRVLRDRYVKGLLRSGCLVEVKQPANEPATKEE
jgi:hypothetical protein